MAGISESYINIKKESKFSHTDYVLLISTICGFSFILIGLLVILVGRRFRSQNSNNAADVELQSPDNKDEETRHLIMKPPIARREFKDISNCTYGDISAIPTRDDYIDMDVFEKKEYDAANESTDNDEQYTKLNDGLFKFMYPQLALYDLFNSPNHSPVKEKQTLLITEITNDEDSSLTKDCIPNIDLDQVSEKNPTVVSNIDLERIQATMKRNIKPLLKVNDKNIDDYDIPEDDDDGRYCKDSMELEHSIADIHSERKKVDENHENDFDNFFEHEPREKLTNITKVVDDDSLLDESPSSKLSTTSTSTSPNLSEVSNGFVEESKTNNVVEKLLIIRSPSICINPIDKDANDVKNALNKMTQETQGESFPTNVDTKMSSRVESLQKDISTFLQKSSNSDDFVDDKIDFIDIENRDSGDAEDQQVESLVDSNNIIDQLLELNLQQTIQIDVDVPIAVQDLFIKSAGDNIHQDDLLVDSPDTSTSTFWPERNYQPSNEDIIHRIGTSTDSIDNPMLSISEERTFKVVSDQSESIPGVNNMSTADHHRPSEKFGNTKGFDFSYTMESFRKDFGISDEMMNYGEISENKLFDSVSEEHGKASGSTALDNKLDVDDSQSSADNNLYPKMLLQTNKNAFSDADNSKISSKFMYRRNVQETVKLFEKAASKSPVLDFKAPLRLHKKH